MPSWTEQLAEINKLRLNRKEQGEKVYASRLGGRTTASGALSDARLELNEAISAIYVDPHPRSVVKRLNDNIPFLLLPVRIETRFITGQSSELWLRVYPDDIAIQTHEKLLTKTEISEGERYWRALFMAEKEVGAQKEDQKKQAWNVIVSTFGPKRSAWVALQTKPANWNEIGTIPIASQLIFPAHEVIKPSAWSMAPRTYEMPDKFVVMLYQGSNIVKEVVGRIIPDELILGPDPLDDDAFGAVDEMLAFGESYDWTSNFEKAVAMGMGFKIPLTPEQATSGFDKILVLGLTLSADAAQTQKNIEELIDNHHYSDKGFSIVKQGTATNNTDEQNTDYTENDPFNNLSYFTETGHPLFTDSDDCDGKNLAKALGIGYEPLQYIQNSDARDLREAKAMNTALYPATLGYYFDTMLSPVLAEDTKQRLRAFFTTYVTGRGSLPAIRVGDQPYGVLLTSDFSKWKSGAEAGADESFLTGLHNVLNSYSNIWNEMVKTKVMYTGKPGVDPADVMMNLIGLQPGSVSFSQRVAYTTDDLKNRANLNDADDIAASIQASFQSKNQVMGFFGMFGFQQVDANGIPRVPQLLRLVYQHYATKLDAKNLIDHRPLSEKDKIEFYDPTIEKNYIHWLLETDSVEKLRRKDFGTDASIVKPNSLLFLNLLRSLLLELHNASNDWFQTNGIVFDSARAAVNFHNIQKSNVTKWEVMKGTVGIARPEHPSKTLPVADYLLTTGRAERGNAYLNSMKKAFAELAGLPTARLERCFVEHIDTCTYRLDAWQTALFSRRLQHQRVSALGGRADQRRVMGLYSGAFGWVEDVRPSSKRRITPRGEIPGQPPADAFKTIYEYADNGGFVHTPSLNHATAAAVLRSGYLNHATSADPDLMAVNLSSRRIRNAKSILEGIANGQSLEALLGYQFERGLHDRGSESDNLKKLNAYIYDFREKYPLQKHIILQQGASEGAEQTIPATDVVNGLALAERELTSTWIPQNLITDNPAFIPVITAEKNKLSDTLDAIKDLLMSESVYQLVQGNFDRGAAVMNAMKNATAPPELDIINTPRSSKFTFTNRVTVQFENRFFEGKSARALMEPGLNHWLQSILGNLNDLAFKVSLADRTLSRDFTVAELGLQPIDLIYIVGNELSTGSGEAGADNSTAASELETRIAHLYSLFQNLEEDAPVLIEFLELNNAGKKPLGELLPMLKMIKSMITDSRALHAQDFLPASREIEADQVNPKGYDVAELEGRIDAAKALFDLNLTQLSTSDTTELMPALVLVSGFGIPDSFPQVTSLATEENRGILLAQAGRVLERMQTMGSQYMALRSQANAAEGVDKKVELLVQAGKVLLGDVFNILPKFHYRNGADIKSSSENRVQLLKYAVENLKMSFAADEWLQQIAHVRPRLARWDGVRTLSEVFNGETLDLLPVQLPYRANDSWVSIEFPAELAPGVPFNIDHDTLSITIHGTGAFDIAESQSGLMIDEIVEMIPGKDEITGIAFNYNQPNAVAPQTLLLAVTPEQTGSWDWDKLVGILNDTLLRAKQRAVEPDLLYQSDRSNVGVLLPAILANFSEYDLDLALDYRTNVAFYNENNSIKTI